MGNEESTPVGPETPPQTLSACTTEALAAYILSPQCKRIVVMTGAGISTSAGIPDFRSPGTGLYANLARLNLPYAEAVFDIGFFRENPEPFYLLAHELYPGKYRPTITHCFIRLLQEKGLLLKLFTQNIDCLEREAGVSDDKIVEAHGSFARQSCIDCKSAYPDDEIRAHIAAKTIPHCHECEGLVKPEIIFFGEQLPAAFFENRMLPAEADLCIVLGTSLTVQPFASLHTMVREGVPRVLVNKEVVGGFGGRADDVVVLGDCDGGVRELAEACGWAGELEGLWEGTRREGVEGGEEEGGKVVEVKEGEVNGKEKSNDEVLEEEIEKITRQVDETLVLSKSHEEKALEAMPSPRTELGAGAKKVAPGAQPTATTHEVDGGHLDHVFGSDREDAAAKPK